MSFTLDLPVPTRALAVVAHPDDAELECGATLAKWAAAGAEISYIVCTDGSKGTWDLGQDQAELVQVRQNEQRLAAERLGARGEVVFLGWTDGELDSGLGQRREVCRWLRTLRPDVVLAHDPWKRYRLHPDHRHAGYLAVEGIVAARDHKFFADLGVEPHRPRNLLLFEAEDPNHAEDVGGFAETKIEAILAHRSQYETTMSITDEQDRSQTEAFVARVRERLAEAGAVAGVPEAELYRNVDDL